MPEEEFKTTSSKQQMNNLLNLDFMGRVSSARKSENSSRRSISTRMASDFSGDDSSNKTTKFIDLEQSFGDFKPAQMCTSTRNVAFKTFMNEQRQVLNRRLQRDEEMLPEINDVRIHDRNSRINGRVSSRKAGIEIDRT